MFSFNGLSLMAASASFALVVGCGGSTETQVEVNDGSDSQVNALLSGVLIDSAVAGVEYTSESSIGITDSDGNFSYRTGESILFSIGDVEFPLVDAVPVVTPQTLASETANPANAVVNIARLLQSLDSDRNPDNGITVSESAAASSSPLNFAAPIAEFAAESGVLNLISTTGSAELVSVQGALDHLNASLGLAIEPPVDEDIVLDLRNSVWVSESAGCDGQLDRIILRYSETRFSGEIVRSFMPDGTCGRETITFDEAFTETEKRPGFLFICGDGLCTFDEINRAVNLSANDPRNDCVDSNGQRVAETREISHIVGSNEFGFSRCRADNYIGIYVRQ